MIDVNTKRMMIGWLPMLYTLRDAAWTCQSRADCQPAAAEIVNALAQCETLQTVMEHFLYREDAIVGSSKEEIDEARQKMYIIFNDIIAMIELMRHYEITEDEMLSLASGIVRFHTTAEALAYTGKERESK